MKLIDIIGSQKRRLAIPLCGFPGAGLIGKSIRQTLTRPDDQVDCIRKLIEELSPDAVFCLMDLTVEAEAVGIGVRFPENGAPSVEEHPVLMAGDLKKLAVPDPGTSGRMSLFGDVVRRLKSATHVPVGAYVIGPFTLAGEMTGVQKLAESTILEPQFAEAVLDFTTRVISAYAASLVKAGADMIAILEPSAVILSPAAFSRFAIPCLEPVIRQVNAAKRIPVLHICGDTMHLIPLMARTGAQGLSLDSPVDLLKAASLVPPDVVLIGNLDPLKVVMEGTPETVKDEALKLLADMRDVPNFILSSGCDLPPETPIANVAALIAAVR